MYGTYMRASIHKTPTQLDLNSSGPTLVRGFRRIACTKQQPADQESHLQCMTTCFTYMTVNTFASPLSSKVNCQ